ncbi:MAG TPA: IS1182 family transposase [Chloroflexota bacterium]|nr:IS1182 family transposase [Chloroflexota bacterium]
MCLQPHPITPVPEETMRVARAAFPKGTAYLRLRDELGIFYRDERFAPLFAQRGRPAEAPWRLALVSVLQFAENLSDRQAAEAVRSRIDWKYLLGLELTDGGFDYSLLSEFRDRLLAGEAEAVLLDALLAHCQDAKLVRARGGQRTDATHVLGAVRVLNRLECVGEALRHALNTLAVAAPTWVRAKIPPDWADRYATRLESARLPSSAADRQALARTIGADGSALLTALWAPTAPGGLRELEAVEVLRQIWVQQFFLEAGRVHWREEGSLPPASLWINSPYDPEVRYGTKRTHTWIGYKVHLTESCDEDLPHLVTQVATTIATGTDYGTLPLVQADLAAKDLRPAEHFVDAGYVDAGLLVRSHAQGIDLVGPVSTAPDWQTRADQGFDQEHFAIDWRTRTAICPRGQHSVAWKTNRDRHGEPVIRIEFAQATCLACPVRARCTRAATYPRTLSLRPRPEFEALRAARARQRTDDFMTRYKQRAGIEGTLSQAVRAFDLRHARYVGQPKTHLQHVLTAVALNVVRLCAWFGGIPRSQTRVSPFASLFLEAA